jgi:hypothetical protein
VESNRYFGSKSFVEKMKEALGYRATGRKIICANDTFELREGQPSYGEAIDLDSGNTFFLGSTHSTGSGSIDHHHP